MYISITGITQYVVEEAIRFSEKIGDSFSDICVKIKEYLGDTYIIFNRSCNKTDTLFFVFSEDGKAKLLHKRSRWLTFKPWNMKAVTFAEWNGFTDPFELSIYVQKHIYEAVKQAYMNKSEYSSYYEQHELDRFNSVLEEYEEPDSDDDYDEKDETDDSTADDEAYTEIDDTIKEDYAHDAEKALPRRISEWHDYIINVNKLHEISRRMSRKPFTEVSEDSYLDCLDDEN